MATNNTEITPLTERRKTVAGLLISKTPKGAIAEQLGVAADTITRDVKAIEELWHKELVEDPVKQRAVELATINKMEQIAWGRYYATNSWVWFDRILRCQAERRKLMGIDKGPDPAGLPIPPEGSIMLRETQVTIRELMINDPRSMELGFELTERLAGNYTFAALESGRGGSGSVEVTGGPGDPGDGE